MAGQERIEPLSTACVFYVNNSLETEEHRQNYDRTVARYLTNQEFEKQLRTLKGQVPLDWLEISSVNNTHWPKPTKQVKVVGLQNELGRSFLKSSSITKYNSCTNK